MKNILFTTLFLLGFFSLSYGQATIQEARQMPIGSVVTVTGIATNGSEMGIIRYFQDETAGIAAYGSSVGTVNRGDEITVTGTLKIYNQLLEIDPVSSVVVNSTGNPLPQPVVLTPNQISEPYEAMLVQVHNVLFNDAGLLFTGNNGYEFTANGETGFIYVKNGQDLVGTVIPTGEVNLTALCSQFHYSNPNDGYQLLPRDLDDISLTSSIYLTGTLINTLFTQTNLDFTWETNIAGTTEIYYGATEETVRDNHFSVAGTASSHSIDIAGLNPGEITWVEAFSVSGGDTAKSAVSSYATISNSSGEMITYFNSQNDVSYSNGVDAIYLPQTMDDTLIQYINRAKYTIDFTIYNFNNNGISDISVALIAAADRGVRVRVIGCGTTLNLGIDELEGTAVSLLIGPDDFERTGIMHNKFIVFDAHSADPNEPLVWTGSTNFTDGQINLDANNVIIIQDQSLARTYEIEFEEMWGSHGDAPDAAKALFGSSKRNNTPHEFMIDGKYVECYFSPSDGVNGKIVEVINTANSDLSVATMLITRTEMANAIADRKSAGVAVNVITNDESGNSSTVNQILQASLSTHNTFDVVSNGMLHHKYMVVDQYATNSDPIVFTGSHNWSAAADNDNDENTLVIHDATLANIYYQNFVYRFVENLGVLIELTDPPTAVDDSVETGVAQLITVSVLDNDIMLAPVTLTIEQPASQGNAFIPFANPNVISYQPDAGFIGLDSIVYKIVYQAEPSLFATAKVYINVVITEPPTAVADIATTSIAELIAIQVKDNDTFLAPVTLSIEQPATKGDSYIPFENSNVINYLPEDNFYGIDSIVYKIAYQAEPTLFATAKVYINVVITESPTAVTDSAATRITELITIQVKENDIFLAPVTLSIEQPATKGDSYIPFENSNVINYLPEEDFYGSDSIVYKIAYSAEPSLFSTATIYINVVNSSGIIDVVKHVKINISPNPASGEVDIEIPKTIFGESSLYLTDLTGKKCFEMKLNGDDKKINLNLNTLGLNAGVYLVKISDGNNIATQKLILQ